MPTTSKKNISSFIRKEGLYIGILFFSVFIILSAHGVFTRLFIALQHKTDQVSLQSQIDTDTAKITQLTDENKTLKEAFGMVIGVPGILAHVITSPDRSIYDTMLIDAGSAEHIAVGKTVYALDSVALGTVSTVYTHSAVISLFSSVGVQTSGSVVGSGISVVLTGRGSGEYEIRMPRDISFAVGDVIAQQSSDTKILATVEKVTGDSRHPFITVRAKTPVNLQTLPWVIIK